MCYLRCLFLVVLLAGLSACSEDNRGKGRKAMEDLATSELLFQEISLETILGRPFQIEIVDSILIIGDNIDGKALFLYNLSDSSWVRVLNIGQGPGEVLAPLAIDVSDRNHTISVLQRQSGISRRYRVDRLFNDSIFDFQEVSLEGADRVAQMHDGYACLGMFEQGILSFFDAQGKESECIDLYSRFDIRDISAKYRLFQGRLAFNERARCLMFAPSYASEIAFYAEQDDGSWMKKDSFCLGTGGFEDRISESSGFELLKDDIRNCMDACSSENYFYMLYDGTDLGHTRKIEFRYVIRFTANGVLDCVYKVNPTVRNICVSYDDSAVYVLMIGKDGEYAIGKSELSIR